MSEQRFILLAVFLSVLSTGCSTSNALKYPPHRWVRDADRKPIAKPKANEPYKLWDIADKQFFHVLERRAGVAARTVDLFTGHKPEALNVNNFDEAPDSTWFTNRIGRRPMTEAELAHGPDTGPGPDPRGPWTVKSAKTEGVTPGFLIQDPRGDRYLIKFDPPKYPEIGTGAEAVATKFFHAFGYNVPENYVVTFDPKILRVAPDATARDRKNKKIPFREEDLSRILEKAAKGERGRYRALASKLLAGEPLGPARFLGRRSGDANDRIPHEHRRELRGYRVFSAFLHHVDSRESNALDMFVKTDGDLGHVKHYLIDFSGTLGSTSVGAKGKDHLYDYRLNYGRVTEAFALVGFYRPYWEDAVSTNDPAVGFFESELFRPETWKPTYPNPVFMNMTDRDAFWAARILMKLSDDAIRAIVSEGKYTRKESADYIAKILIARRDKIGRYWFRRMNPLDDFELNGGRLSFRDLAVDHGFERAADTAYRYRWRGPKGGYEMTDWAGTVGTSVPVDGEVLSRMKDGHVYILRLQTSRKTLETPSPLIDLYLRKKPDGIELVGLQRRS